MAKKNKYYLIDGQKVPSVTEILGIISKDGLLDWYGRLGIVLAKQKLQQASEFGSKVHSAIEAVVQGQELKLEGDLSTIISNFSKWSQNNIAEWVCFEKAIYHDDLKYGGTLDAIAKLKNGKTVLVDVKTSNSIREEYYLQVSAYLNATRIEDDVVNLKNLDGAIILHLDKQTLAWEAVNVPLIGQFDVFKSCITVWKWKNGKT